LQGFSGHGLALTGLAGKLVAEAMSGDASRFDVFSRLQPQPFPGGRVSYSTATPMNLAGSMARRMARTFPQLRGTRAEYAWGGFVDISMNRAPDFGRLPGYDERVYYLQGFSGHGLALTGLAGKLVAEAMSGDASRFDVFARLKHQPFPGGRALRTPALVLGMAYYRLRDLL
jgi:gamma-glutamylputrescine oxidase